YRLPVERAKGRGMWTLHVSREAGTARDARRVLGVAQAGAPRRARGVFLAAQASTPGRASGYSPPRSPDQKRGLPLVSPSVLTASSLPGGKKRVQKERTKETTRVAIEAEGRPDVAAYLERTGFPGLVPKVRKLLDDILDRHDVT